MEVIEGPITTDHRAVMTAFRYRWKDKAKPRKKKKQEEEEEERDFSHLAYSDLPRKKYGRVFKEELVQNPGGYDIDKVSAEAGMETLRLAVKKAGE